MTKGFCKPMPVEAGTKVIDVAAAVFCRPPPRTTGLHGPYKTPEGNSTHASIRRCAYNTNCGWLEVIEATDPRFPRTTTACWFL